MRIPAGIALLALRWLAERTPANGHPVFCISLVVADPAIPGVFETMRSSDRLRIAYYVDWKRNAGEDLCAEQGKDGGNAGAQGRNL